MVLKQWVAGGLVAAVCAAALPVARADDAAKTHYQAGFADFQKGDFAAAGKELVTLAPFDGEYGGRARYLLGRIHQLAHETPEAQADFHAVLAWWNAHKDNAPKTPDYVQRAAFYEAVLAGEQGQYAPAIEQLRTYAGPASTDIKTQLGAEALLRIGLFQVLSKQYPQAIQTLQPLKDHPLFADQALWFIARAQILSAPADNPQNHQKAIEQAIETFKQAAVKALAAAKTDPDALPRRADELLELGDAQMTLQQFIPASENYAAVAAEFASIPATRDRAQEATARQVTALALAGKYPECEALAVKFQQQFPGSLLMAGVLFREAQCVYLRAAQLWTSQSASAGKAADAIATGPIFEQAVKKLARVAADFPEYPYANQARMEWASALYQLGRYRDAAEVLQPIPAADRTGALATASLMQGDCLLRTLPPEGNDALSAARMLMQAEQAAASLAEFANAYPSRPEAPDANFKLGYCYQRIASALADSQPDRWKTWQLARQCYDKVLAAIPWQNPIAAEATFERAKVLMAIGDMTAAVGELRKFQSDPLDKAANAPLALLRLSTILRMQGKAPEAAEMLAKWRAAHETQILENPSLAPCVALIQYEQALALRDAGKPVESRALLAAIAEKFPKTSCGVDSLWRIAQADREQLTQRIIEARWRLTNARRTPQQAAARKDLDDAVLGLQQWVAATKEPAAETLRNAQSTGGEGAVRLVYELAWAYRTLGENKAGDGIAASPHNKAGDGIAGTIDAPRPAPDTAHVPLLASAPSTAPAGNDPMPLPELQLQARDLFQAAIQAGDKGGPAQQETANLARLDLGEMLAQHGMVDQAMDLFTDELEHGLGSNINRDIIRPRLRIAECLLAKGQPQAALAQVALTARSGGPPPPEGRYLMAEAFIQLNQWHQALDMLRLFEDERTYYAGEVADRIFFRLGDVLLHEGQPREATWAFSNVVQRYPRSPLAPEARLKLAICKLPSWPG